MYHVINGITYFAEMLIVYTYISDIFERKYKPLKTIIIGIIIFSVPFFINECKNIVPLNVSAFAFFVCLFFLICYESSILQKIIHSIIITGTMIVAEIVCFYSISLFMGHNSFYSYQDEMSIYVLDVITSKLLFLMVCKIISRFKTKNERKLQRIPISYYLYGFSAFALILCMLVINKNHQFPYAIQILIIVTSIILLFSLIFIFISYEAAAERNSEYIMLKNEMKAIEIDKQYYDILQNKNEEMHQLTHDMKHHLSTIHCLANNTDVDNYIKKIYGKLDAYSSIGKTNNKILDIIINKYITLCEINNVHFQINIKTSNLENMDNDDLSSLFNNILDNALDSSLKSCNPNITLSLNHIQSFNILTCTNSCDTPPKSNHGELKSTKKNNKNDLHGYGTKSIKRIVKKYFGEYEWQYSDKDKQFTTTIMFPENN